MLCVSEEEREVVSDPILIVLMCYVTSVEENQQTGRQTMLLHSRKHFMIYDLQNVTI